MRNRVLIRILVETGARINEIGEIKKKDVDLDNMTIWLNVSKTNVRAVFMSPETAALLKTCLDSIEDDGNADVFPGTDSLKKTVTRMLEQIGLKESKDGRGPHTFRHYTATYLYYTGKMDLTDVATYLGDTPDVIRERYLHPTPKMLRARVAGAFGWRK